MSSTTRLETNQLEDNYSRGEESKQPNVPRAFKDSEATDVMKSTMEVLEEVLFFETNRKERYS